MINLEQKKSIIDISVEIGTESIDFPGDPPFNREVLSMVEAPGDYELSQLHMSAHVGTHIDAPSHFVPDGKTIGDYAIRDFILPARVVDVGSASVVDADHVRHLDVEPGEALLFKTANSSRGLSRSGVFRDDYVFMGPDCAERCVEKGLELVGLDYITIERPGDDAFPAHRTLLGQGILVLEGIDLSEVAEGRYTLSCVPLKLGKSEASPVRAFLIPSG